MPTPSFCRVERRFHIRESNRQPLPLKLGISPPSSNSLRWGIMELQCCNYCQFPSDFPSNFRSSMTTCHHKLLTRESRILANGWSHSLSIIHNNICNLNHKKSVIRKVPIATLNTICRRQVGGWKTT